jgi:DNA-binding CsgD family transcriptional regulator
MERLTHSDYARLLDFVGGLLEARDTKGFAANIVSLTSELLPGAIVAFDQIEVGGSFYGIDHNVPLDAAEQQRMHSRLMEVYQQNPIYQYIQGGGSGPVVDLVDLAPRRELMRTDFYQDIFRPYGIEHQVSVLLSRPGWINTLTINSDRAITARTKTMLALASRHLCAAHRIVWDTERAASMTGNPSALGFTSRELEVMKWLQAGKRNSEIAIILGCSTRTIGKHVENILRKTGAETRTAAVQTWSADTNTSRT